MDFYKATETFHLVVENKSFSKAASLKYATVSAISKQITWLEEHLGVQLLRRSTRKLDLTDEGRLFYQESKALSGKFNALKSTLRDTQADLTGEIKLSAPISYGETILRGLISQFMRQNPGISLNVSLSNNYIDIIEEHVDVAIRIGPVDQKRYQSYQIGLSQPGLFAAPSFLKQNPINSLEALRETECLVHSDFKPARLWRFKSGVVEVTPKLKSDNTKVLIEAAVSGLGILYLSDYIVQSEVTDKRLVPILESEWPEPIPIHLFHVRQANLSRKLKVFIDRVKKSLT